jgi:hypothetical protein
LAFSDGNKLLHRPKSNTFTSPRTCHFSGPLTIQPRGFGGSSVIFTKLPDAERSPEQKRTVVLVSNVKQTRAALAPGMRIISIDTKDPLADATLLTFAIDFLLDDISTPGSYCLNPPSCQDDVMETAWIFSKL